MDVFLTIGYVDLFTGLLDHDMGLDSVHEVQGDVVMDVLLDLFPVSKMQVMYLLFAQLLFLTQFYYSTRV